MASSLPERMFSNEDILKGTTSTDLDQLQVIPCSLQQGEPTQRRLFFFFFSHFFYFFFRGGALANVHMRATVLSGVYAGKAGYCFLASGSRGPRRACLSIGHVI